MKFCSECGHPVSNQIVGNDPIARFYCKSCNTVHYQNPKILVSCYATWGNKALWIRRGTAPFIGKWTVPSGFAEQGESLMEAAARELYEETRAKVDLEKMALHMVGNLLSMNQVYIVFRAPLLAPEFETTDEALEAKLFAAEEFPYEDFAFQEVVDNIPLFYRDLNRNDFRVYMGTLLNGVNTIKEVPRSY